MARIERSNEKHQRQAKPKVKDALDDSTNWEVGCEVCGNKPTVGDLGLCGPCCFGEADTAGGNW